MTNSIKEMIDCAIFFEQAINTCLAQNTLAKPEPFFSEKLAKELPKILRGMPFKGLPCQTWKFQGCYVHQKPYVKFISQLSKNGNGRCELGDLLVLCRENDAGQERYNSALFQLKKVDEEGKEFQPNPKTNEIVQLELYSSWPDLTSMGGKSYCIQPHAPSPGAQYLFIHNHTMSPRLTLSSPKKSMSPDGIALGCYLSAFTQWQTGRPISPKNLCQGNSIDGFSKLIWDLVDYIVSKSKSIQRSFGDIMCFISDMREETDFGMNSSTGIDNNYGDNENDGFGILFIDMGND